MKRWRGAALAVCLLLSGCGAEKAETEPEREPAQEEEQPVIETIPPVEEQPVQPVIEMLPPPEELDCADWQLAYGHFLAERVSEAAWLKNPENPDYDPNFAEVEAAEAVGEYSLYDIDKDGTPELLMHYGISEAGAHTTIYSYDDGQVTERADMGSGHSSFYTYPDGNGVARYWGFMDGWFIERLTLTEDGLETETLAEGEYGPGVGSPAIGEVISGSQSLSTYRSSVALPETQALTMPIFDYGSVRIVRPLNAALDTVARARIEAVLRGEEKFYGVSSDGFGGDTGWITLEDYLAPDGVTKYAELPLEITEQTWADLNGDGQSEAVVTLCHAAEDERWSGSGPQVVFSLDTGRDMVFAYCLNYMGGYERRGADFVFNYSDEVIRLAFDGYACYQYYVEEEV